MKIKNKKLLILPLLTLFIFNIKINSAPKTVVLIDDIVKEISQEDFKCDINLWANKIENACKCCLIKFAPEITGIETSAQEIIKTCTNPNKKRCDIDLINRLEKENKLYAFKTPDEKLKKLIEILYKKSIIVREIHPHNITFNQMGYFATPESVAKFLAQAYNENKISNPSFKSADCINITDIMGQKGYQTSQLFVVESACDITPKKYILKEIASKTKEIARLENSSLIKALYPFIYPKREPNFPTFLFPIAYISYSYNNTDHYLSLLDMAPGVLLSNLIIKYKNNEISQEDIKHIYYKVGFSISRFHQRMSYHFKNDNQYDNIMLKPTYVQGDAHQANIFYDKDQDQVIFIDNEKIAADDNNNKPPKDPYYDIRKFFFTTLQMFTPENIKNDRNFINKWLKITISNFLKGYIDVYKEESRTQLLSELYNKFRSDNSYYNWPIIEDVFKEIFSDYSNI